MPATLNPPGTSPGGFSFPGLYGRPPTSKLNGPSRMEGRAHPRSKGRDGPGKQGPLADRIDGTREGLTPRLLDRRSARALRLQEGTRWSVGPVCA